MCTYEKSLSSEQISLDPVLVQQTQSSTELTVPLTLSRMESEMATYETVSDCQKESEYDNIDEAHRTSRSVSEECSDTQERERKKTLVVSDKKGIERPTSFCDEKEGNKDYVYAVVHKQRKGRAISEASAFEKPQNHLQEGTGGLPGNRASCIGLEVNTKAATEETPKTSKNTDYPYAVVDKTKKKKKSPQMPPPYRGLEYADLVHSRENYAKLVKEQSQSVYAHVDQVTTLSVKISEQNHEEAKEGKH
ncbi:hypothetical protein AWC38_SpisGene21087 [Stylophora pistillata]|uniref:Uncharacterized protein n=1 Tax=Stylophora pistillata TaxID=50429 RepID=A0A2B4REM9_STYPI|nr:hypothetical protein AWC38_SpisGene21087 [Stylophora pistillata]